MSWSPEIMAVRTFNKLRRFHSVLRKEDGSISVESMLMLPLLIWCFLGAYVFYDAYRAQFINAKASYTIGDILSRETNYITPEYMDSVFDLQQFLVARTTPVRLRISVITYDEANDQYSVVWSENRGGGGTIDDAALSSMLSAIPEMPDQGRAIVVQTSMVYSPIYAAGITEMQFDDIVVSRPRYAGQLCWNTVSENPTPTTATC
jgi:hypothetical protein